MRKPKLNEFKELAQSHTASKQRHQELNLSLSEARARECSPTLHALHSLLKAPEKSVCM